MTRLFHLKTPKLLPKNAYFIAKFLKFADGDAEAPLSVFFFIINIILKRRRRKKRADKARGTSHKP